MSRIILLGGMVAFLAAAGATTLAFKVTNPELAQRSAIPSEPIDPLSKHLQKLREEIALP